MTQLYIYKSLDGMLGTRTRGGRMEDADESTVLWRHPKTLTFYPVAPSYSRPVTLVVIDI